MLYINYLYEVVIKMLQEKNYLEFKYKGFKCTIVRHDYFSHLCGYVTIPDEKRKNIKYENVEVHGGVTFQGVNSDGQYTIGFDCAHFRDFSRNLESEFEIEPFFDKLEREYNIDFHGVYRDQEYVMRQCKKIVNQII